MNKVQQAILHEDCFLLPNIFEMDFKLPQR